MAENNRNRGSYRNNNQDWDDNQGRKGQNQDDDRYYGTSENRGYGDSGTEVDEGSAGWQSRYEREDSNRMGDRYSSGRYGRHFDSDMNMGTFGNDREHGSTYGSSPSSYGSGSFGRGSRNLYDRDYEGINRGTYANSGTRLGGSNYGSYGDRGQFNEGRFDRDRSYGGFGGSNYGTYNENHSSGRPGGRNQNDRSWWDRASDEVSSWFGDDEAERRRNRDRQLNYRGKGPKNYSRSDERIKEDVNDRLSDDPFIDASEIEVTVNNAEVTLTGTVDHRSTKRRAEDLAESVSGVKNVENRIRVGQTSDYRNPERNAETTGSQSASSTSAIPGSERNRKKDYVTG